MSLAYLLWFWLRVNFGVKDCGSFLLMSEIRKDEIVDEDLNMFLILLLEALITAFLD